jgi:predicted metalloendopeptidase
VEARARRRWKAAAGEALGQAYVQVAFPPESQGDRMQKLVDNLREALKGRIENLAWMTPATKKKALEKWGPSREDRLSRTSGATGRA